MLHDILTPDGKTLCTLLIPEQATSVIQNPRTSIFGIVALEPKNGHTAKSSSTGYRKCGCVSERMCDDHLRKHTVDIQCLESLASFGFDFKHTAIAIAQHNGLSVALPTSTGEQLQRNA